MKKNRSNIFTDGICNTLKDDKNLKMVFFELDFSEIAIINVKIITEIEYNNEIQESFIFHKYFNRVLEIYLKFELDYFIHRTGNGYHFLSPTLIDKIIYKKFMDCLSDINTKCPMTTLRTKPNKYENEKDYFYRIIQSSTEPLLFPNNKKSNCLEMCNFLNSTFNTNFEGSHKGSIIRVKYPLPKKPFNDFGYPTKLTWENEVLRCQD